MHETEEVFNADIAVKELLHLLVKRRVLKLKDVDHILQSGKKPF
jgi:hypothetical protein